MSLVVRTSAFTHQGALRDHNEDVVCVGAWLRSDPMSAPRTADEPLATSFPVMICDGMGGHNAGEIASDLVARILSEALQGECDPGDLIDAIRRANRAVFEQARSDCVTSGMGTTVAGLWISEARFIWFNVGDSRVYRFRDGFLRQLSVDDVRDSGAGKTTAQITQALGGAEAFVEVFPHLGEELVVPGWKYLLCSDGLTDMLPLETIENTLAGGSDDPVSELFHEAMRAGGHDNISIILASVEQQAQA